MKNIYVLSFTKAFNTTKEELTAALQDLTFRSPMSTELSTIGFYGSLGEGSGLVTESGDNLLFCVRKEEKVLPAPFIKEEVEKAVKLAIENDLGREPTKKERAEIKEDVIFDLLPQLIVTRTKDIHAYINPKLNTIVIDSSSKGVTEELTALLSKALSTLPLTSITPEKDVNDTMTEWLDFSISKVASDVGISFALGRDAHFESLGEDSAKGIVKNEDLTGPEVKAHLDAEQYVTKIKLEYKDSITFMLHDDLSVKRIRFSPEFFSENGDYENEQDRKRADFRLMSDELNNMITDLHNEFGVNAIDSLGGK